MTIRLAILAIWEFPIRKVIIYQVNNGHMAPISKVMFNKLILMLIKLTRHMNISQTKLTIGFRAKILPYYPQVLDIIQQNQDKSRFMIF